MNTTRTDHFQVLEPDLGVRAASGISSLNPLDEGSFYVVSRLALALVEFEHGLATLFQNIGLGHSELAATTKSAGEML